VRDDDFEWDDAKAVANAAKHDVTFETARLAFFDPNWIETEEPDPDEDRYRRLCYLEGQVFAVIYVERSNRVRIISARRATKHEQREYFSR
jgi:hypothetical protein